MNSVALIGGSGLSSSAVIETEKKQHVDTPYGVSTVFIGSLRGTDLVFLPRHGEGHAVPPHLINYRANIWALRSLGVRRIIATSAVGSLDHSLAPGTYVLPHDFLDWTTRRESTFSGDGTVVHVDMTEPYCPDIRATLADSLTVRGEVSRDSAVYACTDGPRFETPTEIAALRALGADLVGMTGVPEVVLAREAAICYGSIAIVTNLAAGMTDATLSAAEVNDMMTERLGTLLDVVAQAATSLSDTPTCRCLQALEGSRADEG